MAIVLKDEYLNTNPASLDYPQGSILNSTTPTSTDGTPVDELWGNDQQGFLQAILLEGGVTPSGVPDTARASQYLLALKNIMGLTSASLRTVVSTGPALAADIIVILDATTGILDFTLLSAALAGGRAIKIQRLRTDPGTYACNVLPAGSETLAGESSIPLLPGESIELIPDGGTDHIQFP